MYSGNDNEINRFCQTKQYMFVKYFTTNFEINKFYKLFGEAKKYFPLHKMKVQVQVKCMNFAKIFYI